MIHQTETAEIGLANMILMRQPSELTRDLRAIRTAIDRASVIFTAQAAALAGGTQASVTRQHGVSPTSLWRWQKRWKQNGFAGLLPGKSPGRPRKQATPTP